MSRTIKGLNIDLSNYNVHKLLNYLNAHHINLTTLANTAVAKEIEKLNFNDEKYDFETYELNRKNIIKVRERLEEKYGSLNVYSKFSNLHRDYIYSIFNGSRKMSKDAWVGLSYDAGFVKYNQKEQQTA